MTIKAIITTLDNLPILKEQIRILRADPLIAEIVVVNNGSADETADWLRGQRELVVVNKANDGAGPGRNAGLDAAGEFDYALMLDGGIRPLVGGVGKMLDYLNRTPSADVIGVEIPDFETDYEKAWRRWPAPIEATYVNKRLSHTAYCLSRRRAWDGLRFCEVGPFAQPGWGADDDEMAYQWQAAGISVHVVTGVHPYRRGSGSFNRLYRETGVWPNQYGSVYEQRVVWLQQNWPQYEPGVQWGEPWLTVVVRVTGVEQATGIIKYCHERLRERMFAPPWQNWPNPYSIIAWGNDPEWLNFARWRSLRQYHGDTHVIDGEIVKRITDNEAGWIGDFRLCEAADWESSLRSGGYYHGLVETLEQAEQLINRYNEIHPPQAHKNSPRERRRITWR